MDKYEGRAAGPAVAAMALARHAEKLAKKGRREESRREFRAASEKVREIRGPLGTNGNDVHERSKVAIMIADMAVCTGLEPSFALEIWGRGCRAEVLSYLERGSTDIYYPLGIMRMVMEERGGVADDEVPAVYVPCEKEGDGLLAKLLSWAGRRLGRINLFNGRLERKRGCDEPREEEGPEQRNVQRDE